MGRLPASWIQELLDRVNLRDLVGKYVQLKLKGQRLWGACPFHHETDPSFSVNESQGFYYCFGCGKHGNAIDFVMEMERLDFREACEYLAGIAGLELPADESPQERRNRGLAARIKELNRETAAFYHRILRAAPGEKGAEYLERRGISEQLRSRYGLGYAPDAWRTLCAHLKKKGFTDEEARISGLVHEKNGSRYDAFRDRVIFPIINPRSEVIGFGGRILGDGQPKYLNSPATPAFNKSRSLYNLNTVKQLKNRGELKRLILMEGYMDVIGAARFGVLETCATLGTALTAEQCEIIRRYSDEILICYDGDAAGVKAAGRAVDLLKGAGVKARIIWLPGNMDPDEFMKAEGREAFDELAARAMAPLEFRFAVAARDLDLQDSDQKAEYVKRCVEILRDESNPVDQAEYARKLAEQTNYAPYAIEKLLHQGKTEPAVRVTAPKSLGADAKAENFIAALLVSMPEAGQDLSSILEAEDFLSPPNRSIFNYVSETLSRKTPAGTAEILGIFDSPREKAYADSLVRAFEPYARDKRSRDDMLFQSTKRLLIRKQNRRLEEARRRLRTASAPDEKEAAMARIAELTGELETLRQTRRTPARG